MRRSLAVFTLLTAGTSAALFAEGTGGDMTASVAARAANGYVELVPTLNRDRGTLDGLRGCTDGGEQCGNAGRFRAARGYPLPGESLVLFINGEKADKVQVKRNGTVAMEQQFPSSEIDLGTASDGEQIDVVIQRGSESLEYSLTAGAPKLAPMAVSGGYITNWVYVSGGACSPGWYQVIDGAGTGGRCRSGYTDRAQRGEEVFTEFNGSGNATVGRKYLGSGRVYRSGPYNLPAYIDFFVSTNPSDDYLYTFIDGGPQSHIPIGTRP